MPAVGEGLGKVILLGEHAVVYGASALVAGLAVGVRVEAEVIGEPGLELLGGDGVSLAHAGDGTALGAALEALARGVGAVPPGVILRADTRIPTGCGLGSSAALAVAVTRALAAVAGRALDNEALCAIAGAAEAIFHANPSGVDVAAASQGGLLLFRRGEPPRRLIAPHPPPLVVARVEAAPATRGMVEGVARLRAADPQRVDEAVAAIHGLAGRGAELAERAAWGELGRLFDENQRWLEQLGVSTSGLEAACHTAREAGAAGAKLTGGGGGGCIVAIAPGCRDDVARGLRGHGCEVVALL